MKILLFDFSKPMTFYEFLALILSAIAIMIPIIQIIWNKWIVKEKLNFLPTGRAMLYFNQSGSYIRIDGVYEAEKKPISVKKISIKVVRQKDDRKLNLSWSSFISPVNQNMVGNYLQTTETAHPFRIEANSITSAFTEFGDPFDAFGKNFRVYTTPLFSKIKEIKNSGYRYADAVSRYQSSSEYAYAKELLRKEFFWEIGKYEIDISAEYGKNEVHFRYDISVGEYEQNSLMDNVDEALLSPLKSAYGMAWDYHAAFVELHSK